MVAEDRYAAGCELYPRAQAWELVDVLAISPEERFDVRGLPSLFGVVVHDDSDLGLEIARRLGMGFDGNTMEA
jgi:hypothetical protein